MADEHDMRSKGSMYETIKTEQEGATFILTLHRPQKRNIINKQMRAEIFDALMKVRADASVRAIIVWGGPEVFAAGADLSEMRGRTPMQQFRPFNSLQVGDIWGAVASMLQPTIAAVSGIAVGGGCELALACDLRLASETATFGQPEINVGIIPGAGGTQRLARVVGLTKAKEMIFLGERIDASEALRIGLVNKVVPVGTLLEEAKAWAGKLSEKPPRALQLAKLMVDKGYDLELGAAITMESLSFASLFSTKDQQEGVSAFLEKRQPLFTGE